MESKFAKRLLMGLALALWLVLGWGCRSEGRPSDVLAEEEMVPVLKELQIAYAGVDQTISDPKGKVKKYEEMNSLVLKKHQMDKNQFFSSYSWYEAHPALLDSILKQVIMSLNEDMIELQQGPAQMPSK